MTKTKVSAKSLEVAREIVGELVATWGRTFEERNDVQNKFAAALDAARSEYTPTQLKFNTSVTPSKIEVVEGNCIVTLPEGFTVKAQAPKVSEGDRERAGRLAMEFLKRMVAAFETASKANDDLQPLETTIKVDALASGIAQAFAEIRAESQPKPLSESEMCVDGMPGDHEANVAATEYGLEKSEPCPACGEEVSWNYRHDDFLAGVSWLRSRLKLRSVSEVREGAATAFLRQQAQFANELQAERELSDRLSRRCSDLIEALERLKPFGSPKDWMPEQRSAIAALKAHALARKGTT